MSQTDDFVELHQLIRRALPLMQDAELVPLENSAPSAFDILCVPPVDLPVERLFDAQDTVYAQIARRLEMRDGAGARNVRAIVSKSVLILKDPGKAAAYQAWYRANYTECSNASATDSPTSASSPVPDPAQEPHSGSYGAPAPSLREGILYRLLWLSMSCLCAIIFPPTRGWIAWTILVTGTFALVVLRRRGLTVNWLPASYAVAGIALLMPSQRTGQDLASTAATQAVANVIERPYALSRLDTAQKRAEEAKLLVIDAHMLLKQAVKRKKAGLSGHVEIERAVGQADRLLRQALELCKQALQFDPTCKLAYLERGFAHHYVGNDHEALTAVEEGLRHTPDDRELMELRQNLLDTFAQNGKGRN